MTFAQDMAPFRGHFDIELIDAINSAVCCRFDAVMQGI